MKNPFSKIFGRAPVSIRWSLFRNMTLLVVLIAGAILVTMFIGSSRNLEWFGNQAIREATDHTKTELERFFQPVAHLLTITQHWGEESILNPKDPHSIMAIMVPVLQHYRQILSVHTGDPDGNGVMLLRDGENWLTREVHPQEWGKKSHWTRWKDEDTKIEEWDKEEGYDPRTRPWYTEALDVRERMLKQGKGSVEHHEVAWTEPYSFFATHEPIISASVPVNRKDGSFYIMDLDVSLESISEFTMKLHPSDRGLAFVLSEGGLTVGLPRNDLYPTAAARKEVICTSVRNLPIPVIQDAIKTLGKKKVGENDNLRFRSGGETWWGGARRFDLGPIDKFKIAVAAPEDDFLGDIKKRRYVLFAVSVVALAVAFLMANLLARKYSRPLGELAHRSERIRNLDMSEAPPVVSELKEVKELADAQERMRTALKSFSTYIPLEVVKELVRRGQAAKIGGKIENLTVMFTDIQNFTTLAEATDPEQLTNHMAEYFEAMLQIIGEEKGTVDKFIGDSIVAFWGAPTNNPDHAVFAVRAALRLRVKVHELNQKWEREGKAPFPTRFGIATGPVLVGNVGATQRLNYTVIGDTVNLASRLEGINREYGTEIMVSKSVKEATGNQFTWREVANVQVKGKTHSVEIFELIGENK